MTRTSGSVSLVCLATLALVAALAQAPAAAPEPDITARDGAALDAPQQAAQRVSRFYMIRVKPGMDAQWMEGAKKHIAWHRQQKDSWAWTGFFVETGKNTGMYGWISQGHTWADLDAYDAKMSAGDGENAMATTGPYEQSYTSGVSVAMTDVSHPAPAGSPVALVNVTHYTIHPAKRMQFLDAIRTAHNALQKGGFTGSYAWSEQVSGADGMVITVTSPMKGWADMADDPAFERIMTAQLGAEGMAKLFASFFDAVANVESWTARILPDLSYTPGT